jgi:glyoxylase I family protein
MSSPRPHHLNLAGTKVEETAAFYREVLGLVPAEIPRIFGNDYDNPLARAQVFLQDARGYQYHIITDDPGFAERNNLAVNPMGGGHLAFRVDDIAAVRAKLDALGATYSDMGVWAVEGWHQLFCTDPDGRVIEFHQLVGDHGASAGGQ